MTNEELDKARAKEAQRLFLDGDELAVVHAARLAREGWTPPVAVDPDREEAITLAKKFGLAHYTPVLDGIKRGRALAAEAKPRLVWVKHDGSKESPVPEDAWVWTKPFTSTPDLACDLNWKHITHYAIITPPAEDVA